MDSETKTAEAPGLHRESKARHLTMIVIDGFIGTGLFIVSGAAISQAGPGRALSSYMLIGLIVYFPMTSLGELAAYMPVSGSFATYGQNYVEEGFGFTLGWNYWYNWAVTIAADLVAAQLVTNWWLPDTPDWIWGALFLGVVFLLDYVSVRGFGEAEYWFSLIKITTVTVFITVGVLMVIDIFKDAQPADWSNWTIDETLFADDFAVMIGITMIVGLSFQGIELVGTAAGESEDPVKSVPCAVRQVFWRALSFYVFAILIINLIIPCTDPSLLHNGVKGINVSPFTLIFQHAGLLFAAAVINAAIPTAVLSAGNFGMYASICMLYTLTCDSKTPCIFAKLSRGGVPRNTLYATTVIAGLCFLTSTFGNQTVYLWLLNAFGTTGFIAWLGIAISHYRFRRGYVLQGHDINDLSYCFGFFPLRPIFAFTLCLIITLSQNYETFLRDITGWSDVAAAYTDIPLFLTIRFGYRLTKGTHFVRYSEMRFPQSDKK